MAIKDEIQGPKGYMKKVRVITSELHEKWRMQHLKNMKKKRD